MTIRLPSRLPSPTAASALMASALVAGAAVFVLASMTVTRQARSPRLEHLRHFGFAVVDCGFDDPLDGVPKTDYTDEVASFSNVAHMCVFDPAESVVARLDGMRTLALRAVLSVENLFFDRVPDPNTPSGWRLVLRPDHLARWQTFRARNAAALDATHVAAFYLADEPFWNGASAADLESVASAVQATHPAVPTLLIEAHPALPSLVVPTSVDWIGFARYGVLDPNHDPAYLADLALLKARRSSPHQRIVLVMESQWFPAYGALGVPPDDMGPVALNYYALARRETSVVALLGYLWPGGMDAPDQWGARELPPSVHAIYRLLGSWITGK